MEEIWRDIPDYEGLYQASNLGRVRSLDREVNHNYGGKALKKGTILKPHPTSYDHRQVTLYKDTKAHYLILARVIWETFNGPIPPGLQVNHIDENPANNALSNLNLMTPKENSNWGTRNQRIGPKVSKALKGKQLYDDNPKARTIMEYNKNDVPVCFWFSIKGAAEYHQKDRTTIMLNLAGKTKSLKDGTYFKYMKMETC